MASPPRPRRIAHQNRRKQHRAIRQSAYCRRLTKEYEKELAHQVRHSEAWWKWYHSPRQVAKRKRARLLAGRRRQARVRREKKDLAKAGKKFVAFAPCPGVVALKARRARARRRKLQREKKAEARYQACRKAQAAQSSAKSSKSLKARRAGKSAKSTKARSGRTRC